MGTSASSLDLTPPDLDAPRSFLVRLAHLGFMDTDTQNTSPRTLEVLSLPELAERLHVTAQTLYDLRAKGRGPRGFRVGPRLLFRVVEIEDWLARMEAEDARRRDRSRQ
jgi:predicted DNA-binding transcriptional regulator AlpA